MSYKDPQLQFFLAFSARNPGDFWSQLETIAQLSLDDICREDILFSVRSYIHETAEGTIESISRAENERILKKTALIAKSARALRNAIDGSKPRREYLANYDLPADFDAFNLDELKAFLNTLEASCECARKKYSIESIAVSRKKGRPKNNALATLIANLHRHYWVSGGNSRTSWSARLARHDGPFVRFVLFVHEAMVKPIGYTKLSDAALADAIDRQLRRRRGKIKSAE